MIQEHDVERMVRQNVLVCLSSMVSTLAAGGCSISAGRSGRDEKALALSTLADQAVELCAPVLDYEEAARQAKWDRDAPHGVIYCHYRASDSKAEEKEANTWQEACESDGLDPYEWEIFEHWAVSEWLAEKLEAAGERVDRDFAGLCVWGRTCTGQGIAQDGVIRQICAEMMAPAA